MDGHATDTTEIKITAAMIEAGVSTIREFRIGESEAKIVETIYLAMEIERQAIPSTVETTEQR